MSVNDEGEIEIPKERVIGKSKDLFGDKLYSDLGDQLLDSVQDTDDANFESTAKDISKKITDFLYKEVVNRVAEDYGLTKREANRQQKRLEKETEQEFKRIADEFNDQKKIADATYSKEQDSARNQHELNKAKAKYETAVQGIIEDFNNKIQDRVKKTVGDVPAKVIDRVEKNEEQKKINNVEEDARAHLCGFSRTIPSFIMAYGDKNLTLQNFDDYTEDDVFKKVTGITEDQFRFLRDGGDYIDAEANETKHFDGHLFDEVCLMIRFSSS